MGNWSQEYTDTIKDVGIGSKSHDLFGADLMILRISSPDMVLKATNLFLQEPGTGIGTSRQ